MANAINWFEIPSKDFDRARKFYEAIFKVEMPVQNMGGIDMAFFPADGMSGEVGGAVVHGEMMSPGADGPLLYLNGGEDLQNVLSRVAGAGGQVVLPKTQITDEIGYFAIFMDCEGNRVALHSQG